MLTFGHCHQIQSVAEGDENVIRFAGFGQMKIFDLMMALKRKSQGS